VEVALNITHGGGAPASEYAKVRKFFDAVAGAPSGPVVLVQ
jgi:hypothetical protein